MMTIHLPNELEREIQAEVLVGHFASVDEAMAEAVRLLLRRRRQEQEEGKTAEIVPPALTEEELADQEVQRRLFAVGLLNEIKPPIRDLTSYRDRKAIPIQGEPLSETVIRERR